MSDSLVFPLPHTADPKKRSKLVKYYNSLNDVEKRLLQLLSVHYVPINKTNLSTLWNSLNPTDRGNVVFKSSNITSYIDKLLAMDLIVGGSNFQCHNLIVEIVTRDIVNTPLFEGFIGAINPNQPNQNLNIMRTSFTPAHLFREVRIGLYRQDLEYIMQQIKMVNAFQRFEHLPLEQMLILICNNPFDREWFSTLKPEIKEVLTFELLEYSLLYLDPLGEFMQLIEAEVAQNLELSFTPLLIENLTYRGRIKDAEAIYARTPPKIGMECLEANFHFLRGNSQGAIRLYEEAIKSAKKTAGKRKVILPRMSGILFVLALLQEGSPSSLARALEYTTIGATARQVTQPSYQALLAITKLQQGDLSQKEQLSKMSILPQSQDNCINPLIRTLCLYWANPETPKNTFLSLLSPLHEAARSAGYLWIAQVADDLMARVGVTSPAGKGFGVVKVKVADLNLCEILTVKADWQVQLTALLNLSPKTDRAKPESALRIAWFLSPNYCVQPKEQSMSAKGNWSKGRPIALKRLREQSPPIPHITPQDQRVIDRMIFTDTYYGNQYEFEESAISSLVGHPIVFWEDSPNIPVEVVKGEPELLVKKAKNDRLILQLSPNLSNTKEVVIVKETPTKLKVIELTEEHQRIAKVLGPKNKLEVPESAREQVLQAIHSISQLLTVHSDIGGGVEAEMVAPDPRIHGHLLPSTTGLKVSLLVRPFATDGPYFLPGQGGETVLAEIEGRRLQTTRNLKEEKKLVAKTINSCPSLLTGESTEKEWLIEDPESCLELLMELQALGDEVVIKHPEGEKFRVSRSLDMNNLHLRISRQNDWFAAEGKLQVSPDQVLDMQQVLQLLDQTSSRFIPIGDGQFLALTQEFRKRLDELRAYGTRSGKDLRLHPLAAVAMEDWLQEAGSFVPDRDWQNHIQRLREIQTLEPELPTTLQAELRDYQQEGFRWLARLAHWGVGACLADDMGLGKTLQSIALLLSRAEEGPSLVIAPTSVCMNWIDEAEKFAPTLNVIQLGTGNRQRIIDELQPQDLLVCSYGLLQQDEVAEMLAKVFWETIVLDEAQSIKNFATKRSQAAMNLQGGFKLLTTGTPIENHLGELWNLFRFINPGLLGSLENFNQRYSAPIERNNDRDARERLKKLIQPFILRRTKNQVLQELPSRTEVVLQVELSQAETTFYEALRQEALTQLSSSDDHPGAKHLKVLAAIMKLRRACCNPQLVRPEMDIPSAKLQLFGEVLQELLENNHKALVFSQFVDHLHLIEDYLKAQKISYQYLDGSTPAPERKKRVKAFQEGAGDVFLISLKAGGTGLNLTAADFVIHMDPWWNPAVEDQASDRAHRIGQQRPVTIYRFITQGTIEEKIVKLHQQKRDLADSLLEGTEMSGKVSTEDLLKLISEV